MKKTFDKNGKTIEIGNDVMMPEPNETDIYLFEFAGIVDDILDNGNIIVEDEDSYFFEIEANRVEKL